MSPFIHPPVGGDSTAVHSVVAAGPYVGKVFGVTIVATRCIETVIPLDAAARPLETREASSAMPVAVTLARTSGKVFGVAIDATVGATRHAGVRRRKAHRRSSKS